MSGSAEIALVVSTLPTWKADRQDSLSADEHARAARFVRDQDRSAFVAGRTLARAMLARRAGCRPNEIGLLPDDQGRPRITSPASLREHDLSVSHTQGLVGVAIVERGNIGLDIEPVDRSVDLAHLSDTVLAASERAYVQGPSGEAPELRFLRLWTLKEAYLKARGIGLAADLRTIVFDLESYPIRAALPQGDENDWTFVQHIWPTGHIVAICCAGLKTSVRFCCGRSHPFHD